MADVNSRVIVISGGSRGLGLRWCDTFSPPERMSPPTAARPATTRWH